MDQEGKDKTRWNKIVERKIVIISTVGAFVCSSDQINNPPSEANKDNFHDCQVEMEGTEIPQIPRKIQVTADKNNQV